MNPFYIRFFIGLIALMGIVWLVNYFRRKLGTLRVRHYSFPREWLGALERNVAIYHRLPFDLRQSLQNMVVSFVDGKAWFPCGGLETVTDEMKVTIAGHACVLLLNRQGGLTFGRMRNVHVYPSSYLVPAHEEDVAAGGDPWPEGAAVIAWDGVKHTGRDLRDQNNPELAALSRQLGGEDAPSANDFQYTTWARFLGPEFASGSSAGGSNAALAENYEARSVIDLFAVATETFFEAPQQLQSRQPDLYSAMRSFYRMDPARWKKA